MSFNLNRRGLLKRGSLALLGAGAASQIEPAAHAQKSAAKAPAVPTSKAEDCNCALGADGSPLDTGTSEMRP